MSNLPNIITSVRLFAALALILMCMVGSARPMFIPLFVAGGVSDMLDGFIARRFNWCTEFGATLDSVSDLCLYIAVVTFFTLNAATDFSKGFPFLILGAAVQAAHILYAYLRFKQFPAYHTTFSRVCAYAMFFGAIIFWQTRATWILPVLGVFWTLCSIEGIAITGLLKQPAKNLDGLHVVLSGRR
jgi:CDP-diacylglycerol--glycerol-3-phosphate 3-phosphatidyltransferase